MISRIRTFVFASMAVAAMLIAQPAFAGPPLLCFPFEIGQARTLPMSPMAKRNWHAIDPTYDVSHLIDDTMALLMPHSPVMVRMETIRRATIYASVHPRIAVALLERLQDRARVPAPTVALAVFDFGYLVETYKEARYMFSEPIPALDQIDGYQLVLKASALQNDAAMQQAARLIVEGKPARSTK
jgi:hypothetical protein